MLTPQALRALYRTDDDLAAGLTGEAPEVGQLEAILAGSPVGALQKLLSKAGRVEPKVGKTAKKPGKAAKAGKVIDEALPDAAEWAKAAEEAQGAKPLFTQPPETEPPIRAQGQLKGSIGAPGTVKISDVSERVRDAMANPEVRRQIMAFAKAKATYGKRWYNTKQLKDAWIEELGPEEGEKWFNSFMDMMGAYSPMNQVVPNTRQASNAYRRVKSGEPLFEPYQDPPGKGPWHADPTTEEGYGSLATATHQGFLKQVMEGGGMDPVTNPKTPRFAENLKGNFTPEAVDMIMMRLMGMSAKDPRFLTGAAAKDFKAGKLTMEQALKNPNAWEQKPATMTEYPHLEKYFSDMARELGMTPAQFQASVWLGGGKTAGLKSSDTLSFVEIFHDQILRRAGLEGWTPKETLKKFIRGETALEMGAGLVLFDQLSPDEQQQAITAAGGA